MREYTKIIEQKLRMKMLRCRGAKTELDWEDWINDVFRPYINKKFPIIITIGYGQQIKGGLDFMDIMPIFWKITQNNKILIKTN